MSRNGQDAALILATIPMSPGAVFSRHVHPMHQLAWSDAGVLQVTTDAGTWVLPPTRALWVPAGLEHETAATGPTTLRGIYLDPQRCPIAWPAAQAVTVSDLLAALLLHLTGELPADARRRAEALLPDLLQPIPATTIHLQLPSDDRAREVADALLADPADPRPLSQWGRDIGASARTLSRGFLSTGITQPLAHRGPHPRRAPTPRPEATDQSGRLRGRVPDAQRVRRRVPPGDRDNPRRVLPRHLTALPSAIPLVEDGQQHRVDEYDHAKDHRRHRVAGTKQSPYRESEHGELERDAGGTREPPLRAWCREGAPERDRHGGRHCPASRNPHGLARLNCGVEVV